MIAFGLRYKSIECIVLSEVKQERKIRVKTKTINMKKTCKL